MTREQAVCRALLLAHTLLGFRHPVVLFSSRVSSDALNRLLAQRKE